MVVKLLILGTIYRFLGILDDLTRAVAQFYPTVGGMNGGFGPPPTPDPTNSFLLAAPPSHEAGPSEPKPNSHVEAWECLQRLREGNRRGLNENEKLAKIAEEGLLRLEDQLEAMKAKDAAKDEERRIERLKLLELERTVERDLRYWKNENSALKKVIERFEFRK